MRDTSGTAWTTLTGTKMRIPASSPAAKTARGLGGAPTAFGPVAPRATKAPAPVPTDGDGRRVREAPRVDPPAACPGFRELKLGSPELDGPAWIAAERMARFVARELSLGVVGINWFADDAGAVGGFAHPSVPSRFWIRASEGLAPEEAARFVAHEAKHLQQFRAGHRGGDPRLDPLLEEEAIRYAEDALSRFYDAQGGGEGGRW